MYKERFELLVKAAGNDEDILTLIEDSMNALSSYVNAVYAMEVQIQTLRFRLEGAEYRDAVMELDKRRRSAHEAAIASCSVLNRVASIIGSEAMYTGNLDDRYEVADFCIAIVEELFHGRTKCTVDGLLKSA